MIRTALRLNMGLGLMLLLGASPASAFLEQGAKITFDAKNYLTFEDVGRKTYDGGGVSAGTGVVLHAVRDGQPVDIDLTGQRDVASQVEQIRYVDQDRIWIVSRLGHLANAAVIYNLRVRQIERSYWGTEWGFNISPDGRQTTRVIIAGKYPHEHFTIFVNDLLVYPTVEWAPPGESTAGYFGYPGKFLTALEKYPEDQILQDIKWLDDFSIQFIIAKDCDRDKALKNDQKVHFQQEIITGLIPVQNTYHVTVRLTDLTAAQGEQIKPVFGKGLIFPENSATTSTAMTVRVPEKPSAR